MKKPALYLFAILAILTIVTPLSAQNRKEPTLRNKGWWIGGEAGFWYDTVENLSTASFSIAPEVGYDFNKRWAIGVGIGYAWARYETTLDGQDISANVFLFQPYARWKYCNTGRVSLFLDGGLGVAGGDIDGFKMGIHPGLSVRVSDRVRFQAHLGFLGYCSNYFNDGTDDSDGFGFRVSSSDLKFGFYYTF